LIGGAHFPISIRTSSPRCSRRASVGRWHGQPQFFHPNAERRVVQCLAGGGIEPADDRVGRSLRKEERIPAVGIDVGKALLKRRGQLRQHRRAARREEGNGFHQLALDRWQPSRDHLAHEVDPARDQILQRRPGAAVGNMGDIRAHAIVEQQAGDMRGGSGPCRTVLQLVLIGFHIGDKLGQRVGGKVIAHDEHFGVFHHDADGREVALGIVQRLLVERLVVGMGAAIAEHEQIAIGRGLGHAVRAGHAARAAHVFHHDLLPEAFTHAWGNEACRDIDRTAGGERYDHGHRTGRPLLRGGRRRERHHGCERQCCRLCHRQCCP